MGKTEGENGRRRGSSGWLVTTGSHNNNAKQRSIKKRAGNRCGAKCQRTSRTCGTNQKPAREATNFGKQKPTDPRENEKTAGTRSIGSKKPIDCHPLQKRSSSPLQVGKENRESKIHGTAGL